MIFQETPVKVLYVLSVCFFHQESIYNIGFGQEVMACLN